MRLATNVNDPVGDLLTRIRARWPRAEALPAAACACVDQSSP